VKLRHCENVARYRAACSADSVTSAKQGCTGSKPADSLPELSKLLYELVITKDCVGVVGRVVHDPRTALANDGEQKQHHQDNSDALLVKYFIRDSFLVCGLLALPRSGCGSCWLAWRDILRRRGLRSNSRWGFGRLYFPQGKYCSWTLVRGAFDAILLDRRFAGRHWLALGFGLAKAWRNDFRFFLFLSARASVSTRSTTTVRCFIRLPQSEIRLHGVPGVVRNSKSPTDKSSRGCPRGSSRWQDV